MGMGLLKESVRIVLWLSNLNCRILLINLGFAVPIVNKIDFLCVNIYRSRRSLEIRSNRIKGDINGNFCLDLFHNPFHDCYAWFVGLESHMGIQRRWKPWEIWMACCSDDLFLELADKLACLAGVSSGIEAGRGESLEEIRNNLLDRLGNGSYIKNWSSIDIIWVSNYK